MKTLGLVLTLALALSAPAVAGPVVPVVTDQAGDANALAFPYTRGGQVGILQRALFPEDPFGPGVQTGPASWGPGDLTSARFETMYEAVPVGGDGVDYRATGIRVNLRTVEQPRSAGPATEYVLGAALEDDAGGCELFFETIFPAATTAQPAPTGRLGIGNGLDGCESLSVTDPTLRVTVDPMGLTLEVPLATLPGDWPLAFQEGASLVSTQAWTEAVSFAPRIDATLVGRDFRVGEDMPADVPCTTGCP